MQPEPEEEGPATFMGWTWAGKSWSLTPRGLTCWMALAMTSMAARGPAGSDYLVHQQSFLEALASVRGCEPLESELREAASKLLRAIPAGAVDPRGMPAMPRAQDAGRQPA